MFHHSQGACVCVCVCSCGGRFSWEWGKSNRLDVCTSLWNCLLSVCVCVWLSNFPSSHFLLCFHISNPPTTSLWTHDQFFPLRHLCPLSCSRFLPASSSLSLSCCVSGGSVLYEAGCLLLCGRLKLSGKNNCKLLVLWLLLLPVHPPCSNTLR